MLLFIMFTKSSAAMAAPQGYVTPELLDARIDMRHRSYFSAVLGQEVGHLRARVPMETMPLDRRWLPRFALHILGILVIVTYLLIYCTHYLLF